MEMTKMNTASRTRRRALIRSFRSDPSVNPRHTAQKDFYTWLELIAASCRLGRSHSLSSHPPSPSLSCIVSPAHTHFLDPIYLITPTHPHTINPHIHLELL